MLWIPIDRLFSFSFYIVTEYHILLWWKANRYVRLYRTLFVCQDKGDFFCINLKISSSSDIFERFSSLMWAYLLYCSFSFSRGSFLMTLIFFSHYYVPNYFSANLIWWTTSIFFVILSSPETVHLSLLWSNTANSHWKAAKPAL